MKRTSDLQMRNYFETHATTILKAHHTLADARTDPHGTLECDEIPRYGGIRANERIPKVQRNCACGLVCGSIVGPFIAIYLAFPAGALWRKDDPVCEVGCACDSRAGSGQGRRDGN